MGYLIHKKGNKPPTASKGQMLKLLSLALAFFTIPIILFIVDPVLIMAKYMTRLTNGSEVHHLLEQELDTIYLSTYLFNITNKEGFLSGNDTKLKVEEVGPFTYKEVRMHEELEIDSNDGVFRFSPKVRAEFLPEKSIANPKDVQVVMPNIAMLSLTSIAAGYPSWTRLGYHLLVQRTNSHSIVTMDADSYMWGYEEPLVKFGNTFMPGWITFDTMGFLDRMYDKKNKFRVEAGATNSDKFLIKTFNGKHGLTNWDYDDLDKRSDCNTFTNTYEGLAFPPDITPETPIRIYRPVLCRMLDLDYTGTAYRDYGGTVFTYKLTNKTFTKDHPANQCLCSRGICHDGYSDISPCFYGLPFVLSNAHFYESDPELHSRVEGMEPDPKRHGSHFEIDPGLGAVVETRFALQLNMLIKDIDFNSETKPFSNMIVPVAYFTIESPGLKKEQLVQMEMIYKTAPKLVLATQIISSLVGLLFLSYFMRLLYWNWLCTDGKGIAFQVPTDIKNSSGMPLVSYEDS